MARQYWCIQCKEWISIPRNWTATQTKREHADMHRRQAELFSNHDDLLALDTMLESLYDLPRD